MIPLGFFLLVALRTRPEANWPAVAHIAATIGAVQWARRRVSRLWRMLGLGTAVAASLAVHCQVLIPLIPMHPERDPTARLSGWAPLGTRWGRIRDAAGDTAACADHYGLAAELQFYDPAHRPVAVCIREPGTPLPPGLFYAYLCGPLLEDTGDGRAPTGGSHAGSETSRLARSARARSLRWLSRTRLRAASPQPPC